VLTSRSVDHHASLHVCEDDKGVVLFYCHAGCPQGEVLAWLKARGLWKTKPNHGEPHRSWPSAANLKVTR